jgi:hypothetical protein
MNLMENFKKDLIGNICAGVTCVLLIFALAFYAPAVLKNFSAVTIVLGILAIVIYVAGMFFDLKGADVLIGAAFTAFCFGYYLIGRLESINLIQVNLSDINTYFYVDIVFFILALVSALATAVVKKTK